jgi:hypothetical protein
MNDDVSRMSFITIVNAMRKINQMKSDRMMTKEDILKES